jgi:hypothetical protein
VVGALAVAEAWVVSGVVVLVVVERAAGFRKIGEIKS